MHLSEAAQQAWPPFALVTGLLLVGLLAHAEGAFEWAASELERLPGPPRLLFAGSLLLVALVTAVLNLDTAVVFLTPVLVQAARRRDVDPEAFLYGAIFMANASSLFLPGSNLTNLLVLAREHIAGGTFAARIFPAALAATLVTGGGLLIMFRARLRRGSAAPNPPTPAAPGHLAAVAIVGAATLTVITPDPALPVVAVGVTVTLISVLRGRLDLAAVRDAVGPAALGGLFALTVALGTLARSWGGPAGLLADAGTWSTAALGAAAAISVNNLPAAALLSARAVHHPRALLLGLNLGPNLAVTGSLSAYLWFRVGRQVGMRPSAISFSRRGLVLAPAAMLTGIAAMSLLSTTR